MSGCLDISFMLELVFKEMQPLLFLGPILLGRGIGGAGTGTSDPFPMGTKSQPWGPLVDTLRFCNCQHIVLPAPAPCQDLSALSCILLRPLPAPSPGQAPALPSLCARVRGTGGSGAES